MLISWWWQRNNPCGERQKKINHYSCVWTVSLGDLDFWLCEHNISLKLYIQFFPSENQASALLGSQWKMHFATFPFRHLIFLTRVSELQPPLCVFAYIYMCIALFIFDLLILCLHLTSWSIVDRNYFIIVSITIVMFCVVLVKVVSWLVENHIWHLFMMISIELYKCIHASFSNLDPLSLFALLVEAYDSI